MVDSSILPLKIDGASITKRGITILNDISLEVTKSGLTVIMGPNGSGKTTLLRMMHGLERPREGIVNWSCSQEIARSKQAFVFQTPVMMRRSVLDNIVYPARLRGHSISEAQSMASIWADKVGLLSMAKLEAGFLSGGERQKLALARALINAPEVLFLDEPTANLDGKSTREIEGILTDASTSGTRLIMTTHDVGQAKRLASEVVFLFKGQVSERSPAEKFFLNPSSSAAQAFLQGDILE